MRYRFNKVEINTNSRTISIAGEAQKVQPKVYELILFLLENRDQALSKDDIQDTIWPDVEVTETAMTRAIMKARKLLQDQGDVIKTVHGHGYHFIAEVTVIESAEGISKASKKLSKSLFYALSFLLVVVLAVAFWQFKKVNLDASDISVAVLPFIDQTNEPDLAWAGLGLMSLSTQMIEADNSVDTISGWQTAKIDLSQIADDLTLTEQQLQEFKKQLGFTHLLLGKLSRDDQGMYQLTHTVYHPNGRGEYDAIIGDNPTAMVQKMTKQFITSLPNKNHRSPYRSISEDVFTNELYSRGMGFQIMGDAKKAREYFQLAVNEDASLFWPRYELALTTRKLGLAKESEQELMQLKTELPTLTDEPSAALVLANALGSAKLRQGDEAAALTYYQEGFDGSVEHQRYDYQTIMAGNIAMIYKNMGQFDKAKSWVARAIAVQEEQHIDPTGYPNMLLGQIESLQRNNQAAIQQLDQAIKIFQQRNAQRSMASAMAEKAQVLERQGHWQASLQLLQQTSQIRADMSDKLGVIFNQLSLMGLYLNTGQYTLAESLVEPTMGMMDEIENHVNLKILLRYQVKLAYLMGDYEQAQAILQTMTETQKSSETDEIALKLMWLTGNPSPLTQWLDEYQNNLEPENGITTNNLKATRLKRFIAEQNNTNELVDWLQKEISIANELGLEAMATKAQLNLAQQFVTSGNWEGVDELLQLMSLKQLNWWQITLLKAEFTLHLGDLALARTLAEAAKQAATESWRPVHQASYLNIMNCCETKVE